MSANGSPPLLWRSWKEATMSDGSAWIIGSIVFLIGFVLVGAFLAVGIEAQQDHEFRMACIEQGKTWIEERCE